ncbi:DUF882 domain-containing protein [Thalassotalea sp. HSM 43]|uniref:DUF882 domain-containing protein n=1 Tax=Thalassotalea sp. HSM 43 TaxID=2552945 RepID=UPI0010814CF7|nr:DUF882 domain-containing protein [Thalassotalea sp. HSM 43]QBY05343.1 DUF882 domain-containing protein [Thalassotalea sp. HSM 43]
MSLVCSQRRQFFKKASGMIALGATVPLFSGKAYASLPVTNEVKRLSLYNRHTGERVQGIFYANGSYQSDVMTAFNHNLRDHRQDESARMDPKLFEFLHKIQEYLATDKEIHIISGYRSPKTNAMLAKRSGGVAKKSFHMKGKAIDFAIPGIELSRVRDAAKALKLGGVGYYPGSGFVHIDTAWVRSW